MTDQQWTVVADKDRGDEVDPTMIQEGDRIVYEADEFGFYCLVRIERPVPAVGTELGDWQAALHRAVVSWEDNGGNIENIVRREVEPFITAQQPPTREQIAEALEPDPENRDWETMLYAGRVLALLQKGGER